MLRNNQPWVFDPNNTYWTAVSVNELINANCWIPVPQITALSRPEFGELMLLGFDIEPSDYQGNGQIEMSAYWPKITLNGLKISEKNIHKVFSWEVMIDHCKATVREFGNDIWEYVVTADVDNEDRATFTTVSWLQEWDFVRIAKRSKNSEAIVSRVKITSVDTATKELTFDSPIKMSKWDVIRYMNTAQGGCMDNTKRVWQTETNWLAFDYYTQFFSREVEVLVCDFNKYFNTWSQAYEVFTSQFWIKPANDIFMTVSKQFRYGSWIGWDTSEIKGYDTVIEEREANGLKSIYDFSSITDPKDMQKELEFILNKVYRAPVNSKFVMICNDRFYESYRNIMKELYEQYKLNNKCCEKEPSLVNWMMKWAIDDAPMLDIYISESLSRDEDYSWVAYILPKDLIAGFVPRVYDVTMTEGKNSRLNVVTWTPNMFWTLFTREKVAKATPECKVYEHYTRLWFLYAWVSFRDTYYRIDNFNYNLRFDD